jgi:hypothetical protein
MKTRIFALAAILAVGLSGGFGQSVIENPATPASKTAGRTITLKELLKITDESGEFFFKSPRSLKEGPDGALYVHDSEQLLRFDSDGKFAHNFFKKGQGPGETTMSFAFCVTERGLCFQSLSPPKLIWFDVSGKMIEELPVRVKERMTPVLTAVVGDRYYFSASSFPQVSGEPQYVEAPQSFLSWQGGGDDMKRLGEFPIRSFIVAASGGGGGMMQLVRFTAVPMENARFAIVHTPEYQIKIFDAGTGAVIRTIKRKYERVEPPPPTAEEKKPSMVIDNKPFAFPRQKYQSDISNLWVRGDRIWVVTSTKDPKKGTLVDVFDAAGKYIDAFYLNIPAGPYGIFGDNLYTAEKNPDETYVLKKYRIECRD